MSIQKTNDDDYLGHFYLQFISICKVVTWNSKSPTSHLLNGTPFGIHWAIRKRLHTRWLLPSLTYSEYARTNHQIITEIDETNLHLVEIEVQKESNPQDIFKEKWCGKACYAEICHSVKDYTYLFVFYDGREEKKCVKIFLKKPVLDFPPILFTAISNTWHSVKDYTFVSLIYDGREKICLDILKISLTNLCWISLPFYS